MSIVANSQGKKLTLNIPNTTGITKLRGLSPHARLIRISLLNSQYQDGSMYLGYNTNGFAHHRLDDVIAILHDLGYSGIAITPDVHHLDPMSQNWHHELEHVQDLLQKHHMSCVLESGARFILDPWQKHQPTLMGTCATARKVRRDFLKKLAAAAPALGTDILSFWSGKALDEASPDMLMDRLVDEIRHLLDEIPDTVRLAFEPEPGMFLERISQFEELQYRVNHQRFGLTLDIGHLICQEEDNISEIITQYQSVLWNIHIEDMRPRVHDHLLFGEGVVPFAEVFAALRVIHYSGGLFVELSRHSYDAVRTAQKSLEFLRKHLPVSA
jgi:L-ribulose-5-phosphate 3-epimerase